VPSFSEIVATQYSAALSALGRVAEAYFTAGHLDEAVALLDHVQQIAAASEVRPEDRAALLIQAGETLTYRGSFCTNQYDAAFAILQRAEQAARATDDQLLLAHALDARGRGYYQRTLTTEQGSFDQALSYFQQALALRKAAGDGLGLCESLFHVGLVAERQQRYDEALAAFQMVRVLAEQHGYRGVLKDALRHIGFSHLRAGDLVAALGCFHESLAIIEELGLVVFQPFARLSVGEIFHLLEQWGEALHHYAAGYRQAEQLGLSRAAMQIAYSIGELYEAQNDLAQATDWYRRAQTWAVALGHQRGLVMCEKKLGSAAP
jgi:tetratricopeptide (TPR) repeat protein